MEYFIIFYCKVTNKKDKHMTLWQSGVR